MKTFLPFILIIVTLTSSAQITTPVMKAGFGVDGELKGRIYDSRLAFFDATLATGDDWFVYPGTSGTSSNGTLVIDTTGAAAILQAYSTNVATRYNTFYRGMNRPPYSIVNNRLWLDALFVRDYHGTDTTVFSTGSSKNGQSPADWIGTIQGVPDKNEILDIMMHVRRQGPNLSDSLWLFGGLSIENTTGDRYFDFELYQTDIYYDRTSQEWYGYGPDAGHTSWKFDAAGNIITPGDVIFSASYQSSVLTGIEARIWVDASSLSITPASFNWSGQFDGATNGSQYGYASILPKTAGNFYTGLENPKDTWAGPFGLIRTDNSLVTDYLAGQFMEFSVNLTKLGLDPATILGGNICGSPFNRMVVKTRASASFTAALKDFVAPIDLFLAPRVDVLANAPILCATQSVSDITVQNPSNSSYYSWTTSDGHIVGANTGTKVTVDAPGTYIVTQRLSAGCNPYAYDTVSIVYDASCTVLANTITYFKGNIINDYSQLNWSTAANNETEYFEIQRSFNGNDFSTVGKIIAQSTDDPSSSYAFRENISEIKTPFVYYRLKIKMNSKAIIYSNIVRLNLPIRQNDALLFPNPATSNVQLAMTSDKKQDLKMMVYDFAGVLVEAKILSLRQGSNVFSIATDKWKPGAYMVQLTTENQTIHKKLVIQTQVANH
jgi:hypothetical protein